MAKYFYIITIFISLLFFSACVPTQEDVRNALQTNSATSLKKDAKNLQKLIVKFKEKLDKRNPNNFSKKLETKIYDSIKNSNKNLYIKYKHNVLDNYKDYLQIAFSKDEIFHRNDYLVLGLHYLVEYSYEIPKGHRVTALEYDKKKLDKLYKNLQIIKWKIKVDKDLKGDYLFLTWQNNWQIELAKKLKSNEKLSYEEIQQLKFIKNKKETIQDPSNFSFEIILTQMIDSVKNSLQSLGEEPKELTVKAMFLFL